MMADSENRHCVRLDIEMKNDSVRSTGTDTEQELANAIARPSGIRNERAAFRHALKCSDYLEDSLAPFTA